MDNDFVKVPFYIEADGSKTLFLPEVRLTKGFQIGEKGAEKYYTDYWEALAELLKMPTPRFRRRNKNNIPGIVTCKPDNVEEVKRSYIEDQIKNNNPEK
jgi:hypothetical protein